MDLPPISHIVFQGVVFLYCMIVLTKFVFNPVLAILRERDERMHGDRETARKLAEDAEAQIKLYEDQIYVAKSEAKDLKAKILQEAGRQEREILTQAREEGSSIISQMRNRMRKEADDIVPQLKKDAQQIAHDMASSVLGRNV